MFRDFKRYQWITGIVFSITLLVVSFFYLLSYRGTEDYFVDFDALQVTPQDDGSTMLTVAGITIPDGDYTLSIGYIASQDMYYALRLNLDGVMTGVMPATDEGGNVAIMSFSIADPTDIGRLTMTTEPGENPQIIFIKFSCNKHIYTDGLVWGLLALLAIPFTWIAIYFYGRSTHKMALLAVMMMTFVVFLPYLFFKPVMFGIDTRIQMMRIEGVFYGLRDHQFPVVILPQWNNSYGQLGVLYPNMFLYIPATLRLLGVSTLGTYKMFVLTIILLEGLFAFAAARSVFKEDWQIILTCMILMFGNRHLQNLYQAGKFGGELIAELFYPLIIAGIINLYYRDKRKWYLIGIGMAGIVSSHVLCTMFTTVFVVCISLINIKKLKEKSTWQAIGKAIALFVCLAMGTLVCFGRFYFSDWGKGQLQWINLTQTLVSLYDIFHNMAFFSVFLCISTCLVLMIICRVRKESVSLKKEYYTPLFMIALLLFLMATELFPWVAMTKVIPQLEFITNMIQTSDRFLTLSGAITAFCLPSYLKVCVKSVDGREWYRSRRTQIVVAMCTFLITANMIDATVVYVKAGPLIHDEVCGELYSGNTEDYLPAGTKTEWYDNDTGYIEDMEAVTTLDYKRSGTHVSYSYTSTRDHMIVEFPKFYYVGYTAWDENGNPEVIEKGVHNRTRVYLHQTDTPKTINICYKVAPYLTVAELFGMLSWLVLALITAWRVVQRIDFAPWGY